jgi:hypothetical protein
MQECFEAIRKYDNIIIRELMADKNKFRLRRVNSKGTPRITPQKFTEKFDGTYRTYKEWQKLTPEQRKEVLKAREKIEHERDEKNRDP